MATSKPVKKAVRQATRKFVGEMNKYQAGMVRRPPADLILGIKRTARREEAMRKLHNAAATKKPPAKKAPATRKVKGGSVMS